jgi:hypothetical protein
MYDSESNRRRSFLSQTVAANRYHLFRRHVHPLTRLLMDVQMGFASRGLGWLAAPGKPNVSPASGCRPKLELLFRTPFNESLVVIQIE